MTDPAMAGRPGRLRLGAEFGALYVAAPLMMALAAPPTLLFPVLFAVTGIGLALLHFTPGFSWRELWRGWDRIDWRAVGLFGAATVAVGLAVMLATAPQGLFGLARQNPALMLLVALLYPVLSALPQEIVFRPLFFRRYGPILPGLRPAIWLNAALFSLAHLMYWSWIVAAMTFAGGLAFAWAYEARRNFPMAVAMHAAAGVIVFVLGLGAFFYSGNIVRPF
jgi:membrane protease YdiL (CAAX protease family)